MLTRRRLLQSAAPLGLAGTFGCGRSTAAVPKAPIGEISVLDVIPQGLHAAIRAGAHRGDLAPFLNRALRLARRVIVPKGVYSKAGVVLLAHAGQVLEFDDDAWFLETTPDHVGIAVPNGIRDARIVNPGLIGCATTEITTVVSGHSAILWNSNNEGTAPFGSLAADAMGGEVLHARFKGRRAGASGWNTFIHANMVRGFRAQFCSGRDLVGRASGYGYGIVASGDDITVSDISIIGGIPGQGRHIVYLSYCPRFSISRIQGGRVQSSGIAFNTHASGGNKTGSVTDCSLHDVCLTGETGSAAVELAYQGAAKSGGRGITIRGVRCSNTGASFLMARGYSDLSISDTEVTGFGGRHASTGQTFHGIHLIDCDDSTVDRHRSLCGTNDDKLAHMVVQTSRRVTLRASECINTGPYPQRAAVVLNPTPPGTPDCIVKDVTARLTGNGSWLIPGGIGRPGQIL